MKKGNHDQLNELQRVAIETLIAYRNFTKAERDVNQDLLRFGLGSLSAVGRIKATERAGDATQLDVLRNISKNPDEFQKYVAISLPHLNPAKQIASKKEKAGGAQ